MLEFTSCGSGSSGGKNDSGAMAAACKSILLAVSPLGLPWYFRGLILFFPPPRTALICSKYWQTYNYNCTWIVFIFTTE